jgi:hypothetical protein
MHQRFALDRAGRPTYYLVALGVLGTQWACGVKVEELAPSGLPPVSRAQVSEWVSSFIPTVALRYDLRWTFQTQQGSVRGRAAVQFVPPDSVRFDYRAPFGQSGAAVIVGDDIIWSRPEEDVDRLIQTAPLFWAALGFPRYPAPAASVTGTAEGNQYRWRYALLGDTLTYAALRQPGGSLQVDMRHMADVLGTVEVAFADSTLQPASARMLFPGSASLVIFTVEAIDTLGSVDSSIWMEP